MRLQCNTEDFPDNSIHVESMNLILGPNRSGKTQLCNLLSEGFSGKKKKNFIWNGNEVSSSDYFVYYIKDCDTLDVEKALGAKSIIKGKVENTLEALDEEVLQEVNEKLDIFVEEIQEKISNNLELSKGLRMNFEVNLKEMLIKNLKIELNETSFDRITYSEKRIGYIKLIMENIIQFSQPSVLIVDEVGNGLSIYETEKMVHELEMLAIQNDVIVFFTSSDVYEVQNKIFLLDGMISNTLINQGIAYQQIALDEEVEIAELLSLYNEEEIASMISKKYPMPQVLKYFLSGFHSEVDQQIKEGIIFHK